MDLSRFNDPYERAPTALSKQSRDCAIADGRISRIPVWTCVLITGERAVDRNHSHSPRWVDTTWRRAARPDLLVDVTASGHVESASDAHAGPIQGPGPGFRHMTAAVHLFVVDGVLVVVVGLQGELGAADRALEAARVEKGEVLQGAHSVDLVDSLGAPQARALVEVGPVHGVVVCLAACVVALLCSESSSGSAPDHRSL